MNILFLVLLSYYTHLKSAQSLKLLIIIIQKKESLAALTSLMQDPGSPQVKKWAGTEHNNKVYAQMVSYSIVLDIKTLDVHIQLCIVHKLEMKAYWKYRMYHLCVCSYEFSIRSEIILFIYWNELFSIFFWIRGITDFKALPLHFFIDLNCVYFLCTLLSSIKSSNSLFFLFSSSCPHKTEPQQTHLQI